ncbi:hypothetical protein CLAIMM_05185 [Cladophialophora immunda]|nr:hypothetical protein CLAIMM_05185 [Cladophialophora immunda]
MKATALDTAEAYEGEGRVTIQHALQHDRHRHPTIVDLIGLSWTRLAAEASLSLSILYLDLYSRQHVTPSVGGQKSGPVTNSDRPIKLLLGLKSCMLAALAMEI